MGVSAAVAGFRGLNRRTGVDETDETLVAQLRAGDDAAFEAIYDRYARGVLAFCVHMLGNREAAEDALQLTFVSAFRALTRSEGDVSLRPWLYTIARNRCLSELRTRRGLEDNHVLTDRASPEGVPDQVQRREDLRELLDDMQRLPADQRAALVLFELADHTHEEIAAVLGVRREKVKALVFQAREALARGRRAREHPCAEVRERLATSRGSVLPRSVARAHIDRCPGCAAFEREMRRQRAALALILPVGLSSGLKASVLGSTIRGAGPVAAGGGTAAGGVGGVGAVAAGGTTAGSASGAGAVAAGGTTAVGSVSGAGSVAAAASVAGGVSAGTGTAGTAVIAGVPSVAAVAGGATGVAAEYAASVGGVGGIGAAGVLGKVLTAAAIATAGAGAIHAGDGMRALPASTAAQVAQMLPSNAPTDPITGSAPSPPAAGNASAAVTTPARSGLPTTLGTTTTTILAAAQTSSTATTASGVTPTTLAGTSGPAPASAPGANAPTTTTAPGTTPTAPASVPSTSTTAGTDAPAAPADSDPTAAATTPAAAPTTTGGTVAAGTDSDPATATSPVAPSTTTTATATTTTPAGTSSTGATSSTDTTPSSTSADPSQTTSSASTPSTAGTVSATSGAAAAPAQSDATTSSVPASGTN